MSSRDYRENPQDFGRSFSNNGGKILKPKRLRRLSSSTISSRMSEDEFRAQLVGAYRINRHDSSDKTHDDAHEHNRVYSEKREEASDSSESSASPSPLPISPEKVASTRLICPPNVENRQEMTPRQLGFNNFSSDNLDDDIPVFDSARTFTQVSNDSAFVLPNPPASHPDFSSPDPIPSSSNEDIPSTSTSNDEVELRKVPSRNRGRKTTRTFQSTQGSEIPLPKRVKIAINNENEQNQPITNFPKKKSPFIFRKTQSETTSTSTDSADRPKTAPKVIRTNFIRNYDSTASESENSRIGIVKLHGKNWHGNEWSSEVLQEEGTWVECVDCKKWRYLPNVQDPALLPEDWICKMNPSKEFNDCSKPEYKPAQPGAFKYWVYYDWRCTIGSVVWIGVNSHRLPWPAIVEVEPGIGEFMKKNKHFDSIHVTMMPTELGKFQRPVTKWVPLHQVTPFNDYRPEDAKNILVKQPNIDRTKWRAAYLFAKHASMQENSTKRLENYGLEFQIQRWSEHEAQPGKQIDYESNETVIARLEFSLQKMKRKA